MGKVVSLFGGRSDESEKSVEESPSENQQSIDEAEAERLLADYQYYKANREWIKTANLNAEEMTIFLFDVMKLVKNDKNVDLRRGAMKAMTLEQLTDYLANSGKAQWKAQPHMFGAAYLEFFDRMAVVAMILDEMDKRSTETKE